MRCRHAGLTLVDCLVALSVLAVIAAASLPGLTRFVGQARVVAQANALLVALQQARSLAWSRNSPWTLCLSDDARLCKIGRSGLAGGWLVLPAGLDVDAGATASPAPGLPAQYSARLPEGLAVHGTRLRVTYWPMSRSGTTATFTVCPAMAGIQPRQVIVSQTGRPRVRAVLSAPVCPAAA